MVERAYTVLEIDVLRHVVENKFLWGRYSGPVMQETGNGGFSSGMSRSYREEVKVKIVEEQVRTLMLAGLTAQDILDQEAGDTGKVSA